MKDHIKFCLRKGQIISFYDSCASKDLMYWFNVLSRYKQRFGGNMTLEKEDGHVEWEYKP